MLVPLSHLEQEIAEASNDAARKYYDKKPKEKRFNTSITTIMRATTKSKQQSFKAQFFKYFAIANPKFGDNFLQEVSASLLILWQ